MAFTQFAKDMDIISKLSDTPNVDDGLTAAQLKAKFDEGGNAVKDYINNTLLAEVMERPTFVGLVKSDGRGVTQAVPGVDYQGALGNGDIQSNMFAPTAVAPAAARLETARKIGTASFDGSADISLGDMGAAELGSDKKVLPAQTCSSMTGVTVSRVLALEDMGRMLVVSAAEPCALTVPQHSAVEIPVGSELEILRAGAGAVTIVGASDVYLCNEGGTVEAGKTLTIANQYGIAALKKISQTHWVVSGGVSG